MKKVKKIINVLSISAVSILSLGSIAAHEANAACLQTEEDSSVTLEFGPHRKYPSFYAYRDKDYLPDNVSINFLEAGTYVVNDLNLQNTLSISDPAAKRKDNMGFSYGNSTIAKVSSNGEEFVIRETYNDYRCTQSGYNWQPTLTLTKISDPYQQQRKAATELSVSSAPKPSRLPIRRPSSAPSSVAPASTASQLSSP